MSFVFFFSSLASLMKRKEASIYFLGFLGDETEESLVSLQFVCFLFYMSFDCVY